MEENKYDLKLKIPISGEYSMTANLDRFYGNWSATPIKNFLVDHKEEVIPYFVNILSKENIINLSFTYNYGRLEIETKIDSDNFPITVIYLNSKYSTNFVELKNTFESLKKVFEKLSKKYNDLKFIMERNEDNDQMLIYSIYKQNFDDLKKKVFIIDEIKKELKHIENVEKAIKSSNLDEFGFLEIKRFTDFN